MCAALITTFFSESVIPTRSCVFSSAAEITKLFAGSIMNPGHAHVMWLEVLLVDALHHRDLLGVQVHQLHVVLLGQPVVAVVGEAVHHRPAAVDPP